MNWEHISVVATASSVIIAVLGWILRTLNTIRHNDIEHVDAKLVALVDKMSSVHEDVKDVRTSVASHIAWHLDHPSN